MTVLNINNNVSEDYTYILDTQEIFYDKQSTFASEIFIKIIKLLQMIKKTTWCVFRWVLFSAS